MIKNLIFLIKIIRIFKKYDILKLIANTVKFKFLFIIFTEIISIGVNRIKNLSSSSDGIRIAKALNELGPSFIKLGQLISTRPDIIGNQIAEDSYVNLFSLLAFVNIFLAVFNALPFIPLDGGRVVLAIVEGVTGKKVSDKKLYPIAALVVGVFIFLGITAFYLDITQPIRL